MSKRTPVTFNIIPVWKQVTSEMRAELVDFWQRNRAIGVPGEAERRADEVVCIARGDDGRICAVNTVALKLLPRLQQPMYYYRVFLARAVRGQGQVLPLYKAARQVLEAHNASLPHPESIGILVELESRFLDAFHKEARNTEFDSVFIGYSPRGQQLRVTYFEGAQLLPPAAAPGLGQPDTQPR